MNKITAAASVCDVILFGIYVEIRSVKSAKHSTKVLVLLCMMMLRCWRQSCTPSLTSTLGHR